MSRKEKEPEKKNPLKDVWDFVKVFILTCFVLLLFVNFIAHPVNVNGRSMYPTLKDGDYGFTSRITTKIRDPKRGDVVVVEMDDPNGHDLWVKRIIGLPGDTISCSKGVVYVNGNPLDESDYLDQNYVDEVQNTQNIYFTNDFDEVTLGDDEYFIMGDNRPNSHDSRAVGPVSKEQIYGDGVLVLFPFSEIGVH